MFEQYRAQNWKIKAVSWFSSQVFAYRYTISSAVNAKPGTALTPSKVKSRLKRVHRIWVNRMRELTIRGLWLPSPEYNADIVKQATVKRCMYCRPTNVVFYWDKNQPKLKLCGRRNICPFCYARESEELYRRVCRAIKRFKQLGIPAKATYRCETYKLTAREFSEQDWDFNQISDHAEELHHLLRNERQAFLQLKPEIKKHTFGSFWRVVVNPIDTGWEIQIRQFFITRPKAKRPSKRAKKSAAIFLQSASLSDSKAVKELLGYFVSYPVGLLLSYAEFAAVVLLARAQLKLFFGTGCLYAKTRKRKPPPPNTLPFIP